jgi:phage shock protein A
MALLERVTTLIKANLNDLIDKAEDPEKMIKQVILDMENQLIQVKTKVAVALVDQHLLEKRRAEIEGKAVEWKHKAELAIDKEKDDLARIALERSMSHQRMAESFNQQETDQKAQAELLKSSLKTLREKLEEAQTKRDLLIARNRQARIMHKTIDAQTSGGTQSKENTLGPVENGMTHAEVLGRIQSELASDDVERQFALLEKDGQIDRLLEELKVQRRLKIQPGD